MTAKVVKKGRITDLNEFIAAEDYDGWMRRGLPKSGDVLVTTEAPLGEIAQLDERKVALAQRLIALRGKCGELENDYLKHLMQTASVQQQLVARASGSTVLGIKQSELRKIDLLVPPFPVQQAFTKTIKPIKSLVEKNERMSETLIALRDTLLPKLLSGELRVKTAEKLVEVAA